MELGTLAEAWWSFVALGYDPGSEWEQAFAPALMKSLAATGTRAEHGGGGGAWAASQIIISCANRAGKGAVAEVPGGRPVLEALVQQVLGRREAGPTGEEAGTRSRIQQAESVAANTAAVAKAAETGDPSALLHRRPVRLAEEEAATAEAAAFLPSLTSSPERRLDHSSEEPPADAIVAAVTGLRELDAHQLLLLMDALLALEYCSKGAEELMKKFVAGAQGRP